MNAPHKHAALIKQWADGAEIEQFSIARDKWIHAQAPLWSENVEYRIKPVPHKWQHVIDAFNAGDICQWLNPDTGEWEPKCGKFFSVHEIYRIKPDPVSKKAALAALKQCVNTDNVTAYLLVVKFIGEQQ